MSWKKNMALKSSPDIGRFSQFFHWQTVQISWLVYDICARKFAAYILLSILNRCRYTALRNVNDANQLTFRVYCTS